MVFIGQEKKNSGRDAGEGISRIRPGIVDHLAGEAGHVPGNLSPYLPLELIGGSLPYIYGTEDEAVWNAASQACATEKVHYAYSIEGKRVWYMACPSSALASNPDSWCPLAAALPGQSEHWDKETVYLYEQDGVASALRWDPETGRMQVFLGAARTILPRIQSMDANFVTVNPEIAKILPWKSRAIYSEKLSRATARMLLLSGLCVTFFVIILLFFNFLLISLMNRDLSQVKEETKTATEELMVNAAQSMQSDVFKHMVRVQELLDALRRIDGTLVRYEVNKGKVEWEALVPPAYQQGTGELSGAQVFGGMSTDGRVRIKGTK